MIPKGSSLDLFIQTYQRFSTASGLHIIHPEHGCELSTLYFAATRGHENYDSRRSCRFPMERSPSVQCEAGAATFASGSVVISCRRDRATGVASPGKTPR